MKLTIDEMLELEKGVGLLIATDSGMELCTYAGEMRLVNGGWKVLVRMARDVEIWIDAFDVFDAEDPQD